MNKRTLKALKESIAHWERLEKCKSVDDFFAEGWGTGCCALCQAFPCCNDCPVDKESGDGCINTPYYEFSQEIHKYVDGKRKTRPIKQIRAELNFLRSLLPDGES